MHLNILGGSIYPEQANPFDVAQGSSWAASKDEARREGLPFDPSTHCVCSGSWWASSASRTTTSLIPRQSSGWASWACRRTLRVNAPDVNIQSWAHLAIGSIDRCEGCKSTIADSPNPAPHG